MAFNLTQTLINSHLVVNRAAGPVSLIASTAPTVTATWSARAHRWRRSPEAATSSAEAFDDRRSDLVGRILLNEMLRFR